MICDGFESRHLASKDDEREIGEKRAEGSGMGSNKGLAARGTVKSFLEESKARDASGEACL